MSSPHDNGWLHFVVLAAGTAWSFLATYGQGIAIIFTIVYGASNLFFIWRDKWWRDPKRGAKRRARRMSR